jgi:uncharacterized membrane-anchored protein
MWRRHARLVLVIAIQVAILAAIPLRQVRARLSGTVITLETMPVDPYDVLSGYYVTLRYRAEQPPDAGALREGDGPAWVLLAPAEPAWAPLRLARERPPAGDGTVALRVDVEHGRARIPSAGRFYVPEARREEVDRALRAAGSRALVDLKVDDDGNVALLRLRVGAVVVGAD